MLEERHFIYRQLDVTGIQNCTLGKWWSPFKLVDCSLLFWCFFAEKFVCCVRMSLTGRLISFVRFKLIFFSDLQWICGYLMGFTGTGYRNNRVFPLTNPYISNIVQQCLWSYLELGLPVIQSRSFF